MVDELSGKVVKSLGLPDVGLSLDRIYGGTITPDRRWLVGGIPGMFKLAKIAALADRTAPTVPISPSPRTKTEHPARPQAKVDIPESRQDRTKRQWEPLDLDELKRVESREKKEK